MGTKQLPRGTRMTLPRGAAIFLALLLLWHFRSIFRVLPSLAGASAVKGYRVLTYLAEHHHSQVCPQLQHHSQVCPQLCFELGHSRLVAAHSTWRVCGECWRSDLCQFQCAMHSLPGCTTDSSCRLPSR